MLTSEKSTGSQRGGDINRNKNERGDPTFYLFNGKSGKWKLNSFVQSQVFGSFYTEKYVTEIIT